MLIKRSYELGEKIKDFMDYFERYLTLRNRLYAEDLSDQTEFDICFLLDVLWLKLTVEQQGMTAKSKCINVKTVDASPAAG